MKQKAIPAILSLLILISCNNQNPKNKSDNEVIKPYPHTINISEGFKNAAQLKLSEIADSIKYIVLSKEKEVFIGSFRRLQMTNSDIYISSNSFVMRFDLNGKFLNSFGSLGRGPEEYLPGSVYTTTPKNDKIFILRNMMYNYLSFKPDGEYLGIKELPHQQNLFDFANLSDSVFLFTFYFIGTFMNEDILKSMNCSAGLFDQNAKPIKIIVHPFSKTTPSKTDLKRIISQAPTFTFFDNRIVLTPLGDTIYEIDKNSISPGFIFKWGQTPHNQTIEELYYSQTESSNKVRSFMPVFETTRKVYFRGSKISDYFIFEYDKLIGASKTMMVKEDNFGLINDLDGGTNYFPYWTNRKGDIWITYDDAIKFKKNHNEEFLAKSVAIYPDKKQKLRTFVADLQLDDNPVLKIVYLKKYPDQKEK
jgi:hypothetical protein